MKKIAILHRAGKKWIGGELFIKNLLYALHGVVNAKEYEITAVYLSTDEEYITFNEKNIKKLHISSQSYFQHYPRRLYKKVLNRVSRMTNDENFDYLYNNDPPEIEKILRDYQFDFVYPHLSTVPLYAIPSATQVFDFISEEYYRNYGTDGAEIACDLYMQHMKTIVKTKSPITFPSRHTKTLFYSYFPHAKNRTYLLQFVVYPEKSWYKESPSRVTTALHLPEKYFMVSNQFWEHKNHFLLLEALHLLHRKRIYPIFVLNGRLTDRHEGVASERLDLFMKLIHQYNLRKQLFVFGLLPRHQHIQVMRNASMIVQPSSSEGWSTVIEDAKTLGKTTLASDIPIHKEQCDEGSVFFSDRNPQDLARAIESCWKKRTPVGHNKKKEAEARKHAIIRSKAYGNKFISMLDELTDR